MCSIIIIGSMVSGVAGFVAGKPEPIVGLLFFGGIAYLILLCDRGFGEPTWKVKRESLGL